MIRKISQKLQLSYYQYLESHLKPLICPQLTHINHNYSNSHSFTLKLYESNIDSYMLHEFHHLDLDCPEFIIHSHCLLIRHQSITIFFNYLSIKSKGQLTEALYMLKPYLNYVNGGFTI